MGKSTKEKSTPPVYRGQSYDELMAGLKWLFKQADLSRERRGDLFRLARHLRRSHLNSTGCGKAANQRTYQAVEKELTRGERQNLKRRQARDRRNAGTYPKGRQIPVVG